jgi:hypothetical protein
MTSATSSTRAAGQQEAERLVRELFRISPGPLARVARSLAAARAYLPCYRADDSRPPPSQSPGPPSVWPGPDG